MTNPLTSALEQSVASRSQIGDPPPGAWSWRGPFVQGAGLNLPHLNDAHFVELKGPKIQVGPFNSAESADQYVRQQGNGAEHVYTHILPRGWQRIDAATAVGRGSPPSWTGAATSDAMAGGQ